MSTRTAFPDDVLIVLATAPAGLGHIRVTEALRSGLADSVRSCTMGITDPALQWFHRLTSRNPVLKGIFEFTQDNRLIEQTMSRRYRQWLRHHSKEAVAELTELVAVAWPKPKTIVIMASHFGVAHQLAAVKPLLQDQLGIAIYIAVVVTDDSPQEMWAVSGADCIFVPSNTTREIILQHLLSIHPQTPEVITVPYPVSLHVGEQLSQHEYVERLNQLSGKHLRVMVPVSGAAVQLDYYRQLIQILGADNISVSVVTRDSSFTRDFVGWCRTQHCVNLLADRRDAEVVALYEQEYITGIIGVEVTKPSEQAFKALYTPNQRGGSILLFSPPVGRQERDNLAFLRRHRLIPSVDDQARINQWCMDGNRLPVTPALLDRAHHWRGVMLPGDGVQAAVAVKRLIEAGILASMGDFRGYLEGHDEIRSDGVKDIWEKIKSAVL